MAQSKTILTELQAVSLSISAFDLSELRSDSRPEYFSRKFVSRKSEMDQLDAKTKQKAIEEARKKLEF